MGAAHRASHFQRAVLTIGDYIIYMTVGLVAVLILIGLFRQQLVVGGSFSGTIDFDGPSLSSKQGSPDMVVAKLAP